MPETNKQENTKKFADVAQPGKSAPSETSKPVIVTHRALLRDPMMTPDAAKDGGTAPSAPSLPAKSSTKLKLQPGTPKTEGAAADKDLPADPGEDKVTDSTTETIASASEKTIEKATEATPEAETSAKPDTKQPPADLEAEAAAEAEKDAKLQQIIDSKQYFLPINSVEKRRTKRVLVMGIVLSLLLAVVWVDVALDASLIHLPGIKPVTHFFSN